MKKTRAYAAAVALLLLTVSPVAGQQVCGRHDSMVEHLEQKYAERLYAYGLTGSSFLLEIFVSEHTETWSLLVTDTLGRACLMGSGTGWRRVEPEPPLGQETVR